MIVVIGDFIIDKYLHGPCDRISPEAPTPILKVDRTTHVAGGAANLAKNLKSLGADVTLLTTFGNQQDVTLLAEELLSDLKYEAVVTNKVFTIKTRLISQNQQVVRFDVENDAEISESAANQLIEKFKTCCENEKIEAVILSDYDKGLLSQYFLNELYKITKLLRLKVFVDPKRDIKKYENVYAITPNVKEAGQLFKLKLVNTSDVDKNTGHIARLLGVYNVAFVIITLGEEGAYLISQYDALYFNTKKIQVYDVTGAGDTFLAALVFEFVKSYNFHDAIQFANVAAGVSVQKRGTSVVTNYEVQQSVSKQTDVEALTEHVTHLKKVGKKVVFTNGVFDILHPGHLHLINIAKTFGDFLIVGVNGDESVKRIKGDSRPVFNVKQRCSMLASLENVDAVVIFNEDTPFELLEKLKPNVLVKGGDYKKEDVIGKQFADETRIVDLLSNHSTTKIIEQIKK